MTYKDCITNDMSQLIFTSWTSKNKYPDHRTKPCG